MKRSIKNQDPTRKKGNARTAIALTAALALGGAALIARDSDPKAPKVTFETNAQAKTRLADLARVYGDTPLGVSKAEAGDIKEALKAALPVINNDAANRVGKLQRPELQRKIIPGKNEKGEEMSYSFHISVLDDGTRVEYITAGGGSADSSDTVSEHLHVFHNPNGEISIVYGKERKSKDAVTEIHEVSTNSDSAEVYNYNAFVDGPERRYERPGRSTEFEGGKFNTPSVNDIGTGNYFQQIYTGIEKIEAFLAGAEVAVAASPPA